MDERTVEFKLKVCGETLADKGDNDLWRLARLRWLNSTIGSEVIPIGDFDEIKTKGRKVMATGKTMVLGKNGLPESIVINDRQVLAAPICFEVETSNGTVRFDGGIARPEHQSKGLATWATEQRKNGLKLSCEGSMAYDGQMLYTVRLSADTPMEVEDIRLVADYTTYASRYLMGIGFEGGYRPGKQVWDWSGLYDSFWMGNVLAGLHMEFRGDDAYHGPLLRDYKKNAPAAWFNEGKGRVSIETSAGGAGMVASTGSCTISSEPREFKLSMNITPTKPIDTRKQFDIRLYHNKHTGFDKAAEDGANYCNIHHAQALNPVINYPFIVQEPLKEFIRHEHGNGRKVKLYYTIRELTNYAAEGYAFKSLNHEIMQGGKGGGAPWLVEHFVDDLVKATAFINKGSTLISVGNFAEEERTITLDIEWKALGINPAKAECLFPEIEDFQTAGVFIPGDSITIPAKKGVILEIR